MHVQAAAAETLVFSGTFSATAEQLAPLQSIVANPLLQPALTAWLPALTAADSVIPLASQIDVCVWSRGPRQLADTALRLTYAQHHERAEAQLRAAAAASPLWTAPYHWSSEGTALAWTHGQAVVWPTETARSAFFSGTIYADTLLGTWGTLAGRTATALRLTSCPLTITANASGTEEKLTIPGHFPPLAACSTTVLSRAPVGALMSGACGWDGFAAEGWLFSIAETLPEIGLGCAALDDYCLRQGLPTFSDIIFSTSGTCWFAIMPSAPLPTYTVAVPRSEALDTCLAAFASRFRLSVDDMDRQAVALPLPNLLEFPLVIRRTASHWWISSDPLHVDQWAQGEGFIPADQDPRQTLENPTTAVAWFITDPTVVLTQGATYGALLPRWIDRQISPTDQQRQRFAATVLTDYARSLLPAAAVIHSDDHGLEISGHQLSPTLAAVSALVYTTLYPHLIAAEQLTLIQRSNANMEQLIAAMQETAAADQGLWPTDLPSWLSTQTPELQARALSPLIQDVTQSYLYIRPQPAAAGDAQPVQPVLCEDPARTPEQEVLTLRLILSDGSLRTLTGDAAILTWRLAQQLAPTAKGNGVKPAAWAAVADLVE